MANTVSPLRRYLVYLPILLVCTVAMLQAVTIYTHWQACIHFQVCNPPPYFWTLTFWERATTLETPEAPYRNPERRSHAPLKTAPRTLASYGLSAVPASAPSKSQRRRDGTNNRFSALHTHLIHHPRPSE